MTAHDYEPTTEDLEWGRAALTITRNEGFLAMSNARMVWRVSHEKKTVVLINSNRLDTRVGREAYLRTKAILERLGYVVAPA